MAIYEYVGCATAFVESDSTTVWQPAQTPFNVSRIDNVYTQRLLERGLLLQPRRNTPIQTHLIDFDFAIIRYIWSAEAGRDLDTRTYIKNPDRKSNIIGFQRLKNDGEYLQWGNDNTGNGVEAVLCDVKAISKDFKQQVIQISLNAYWFREVLTGDVRVQFAMYRGGTMRKNGYDWVNEGGELVQDVTIDANTPIQKTSSKEMGKELALLEYYPKLKRGNLIKF